MRLSFFITLCERVSHNMSNYLAQTTIYAYKKKNTLVEVKLIIHCDLRFNGHRNNVTELMSCVISLFHFFMSRYFAIQTSTISSYLIGYNDNIRGTMKKNSLKAHKPAYIYM